MRAGSRNKSVFVFRQDEIPLKVGGLLVVEVGAEEVTNVYAIFIIHTAHYLHPTSDVMAD